MANEIIDVWLEKNMVKAKMANGRVITVARMLVIKGTPVAIFHKKSSNYFRVYGGYGFNKKVMDTLRNVGVKIIFLNIDNGRIIYRIPIERFVLANKVRFGNEEQEVMNEKFMEIVRGYYVD